MHGRLKVKTTAEKQAEKEKERAGKIKVYKRCMSRIRSLYTDKVYTAEILELMKGILEKIPEYSTLWNWRREVLVTLLTEDTKGQLLEGERNFVAKCLEMNPKAYSLWSHRQWCVKQEPTEERCLAELDLCNLFLRFDERNFHCWDYRRFITKLGNISDEAELGKSQRLIENNFSNYSAWHYRSTLLACTKEVITKELDWAQNGYFTDPSDQSVWLYHQWLLGRKELSDTLLAVCVNYCDDDCTVTALVSKECYKPPSLKVSLGGLEVELVSWTSPTLPSRLWSAQLPADSVALDYKTDEDNLRAELSNDLKVVALVPSLTTRPLFSAPSSVVSEQLSNIQELLELEPDNKWCLLTLFNMLNNENQYKTRDQITQLRSCIVKLCEVDSMRAGYYKDLWSKVLCEAGLDSWWKVPNPSQPLNLNKMFLSCLRHVDYMFALQTLDLSNNNITSLNNFQSMVSLRSLDVSHNKITSLEGLEKCKLLQTLNVSNNSIVNSMALLPGMSCKIRSLDLRSNPVTQEEVYPACVVNSWGMLCVLDGNEL